MKAVATPGFLALGEGVEGFIHLAMQTMGSAGCEPSMVVSGPEVLERKAEDRGCTLHIPSSAPDRVWAIRDDHPGGPVVTFLLPSEY